VLNAKVLNPSIKRNMNFTNLYQSQVSHEKACPRLHDSTTKVEQNGRHSSSTLFIFLIGLNGSNKNNHNNFNSTKLFFETWVRHHGMLQLVVSDRDAKFIASF
jgi:hypothetical protein